MRDPFDRRNELRRAPQSEAFTLAPLLLLKRNNALHLFAESAHLHDRGFFAACLIQWGKVFVEGADDALNGGYKKDAEALVGH